MSEEKELLLSLIASLSLCDNMGDVADDCWTVMRRLEMPVPPDVSDMGELGTWLGRQHHVTTLYGTYLGDDDEDEDD